MPDFEDLRMADLIKKFKAKIEEVANSGKLSKLKDASPKLQDIYNFHLTAHSSFAKQEEYLKNMYSSFNYAALIANDAAKTGKLSSEEVGGQAVLGRQGSLTTPWLTERLGYGRPYPHIILFP